MELPHTQYKRNQLSFSNLVEAVKRLSLPKELDLADKRRELALRRRASEFAD